MAEKSWFYAQNGERQGPVSEAEAQRLVEDGTIGPDTLVWSEGMENWAKASTVLPAMGGTPPTPPPFAPTSVTESPAGAGNNSYGYAPAGDHPTDFQNSVRTVFRKYATFSGRARRPEYWWFVLFSIIASIVLSIIDIMLFTGDVDLLSTIFSLATLIPSIAVGARRLHDIGRTGWWLLLSFIPIIGWIILIIWLAKKGDEHPNEYGPA